jgi:hypothetical protein
MGVPGTFIWIEGRDSVLVLPFGEQSDSRTRHMGWKGPRVTRRTHCPCDSRLPVPLLSDPISWEVLDASGMGGTLSHGRRRRGRNPAQETRDAALVWSGAQH